MIYWVSNGMNMAPAHKQFQALYTDVRHWEELVDFINKNGGPNELYNLTSMFKCTLQWDELEEEYMGIYKHGQIINDPIYALISYNCCLSNAFKSKLGHNVKILVGEMKRAPGKEIAEHVIRPTKIIPLATSAKNVSVRAEWLCQSGRAPSEPSETHQWRITPPPLSIPHVALYIALRLQFCRFFSLCRSPILNKHSGVVANCNQTSEWVHWVHAHHLRRPNGLCEGELF